ncbi:MAG: DEAD/DEAH box helicase [Mogibacterium sp.]|nr:DEAD/DEAH box helicase [Mogibacterium sp.]
MERPDLKELNQMRANLAGIDRRFTALMKGEADQRQAITDACMASLLAYSKDALKQVPIEELSKSHAGIRVSLLQKAGYETLGDVESAGDRGLRAIEGIGDKQVQAIKSIIADFHNHLMDYASVTIRPDDESKENTAIVAAITSFLRGQEHRKALTDLYGFVHSFAEDLLSREVIEKRLQWVFSGRAKKLATVAAYGELFDFFTSDVYTKARDAFRQYDAILQIPPAEAMAAFRADSATYYAIFESIAGDHLPKPLIYSSIPAKLASDIDAMELDLSGFKGTLRSYQQFGTKYILHQKRVLLGDEMGLGKTVQAIAAMTHLRACAQSEAADAEPFFLVVCPASVLINWCRELQKFSDIPVYFLHGPDMEDAFDRWQQSGGAAVTNYETMGRIIDGIDEEMTLAMLVVDEAHYIKNPSARRTRYVRRLNEESEHILLMTGTPLENRVAEMCQLIDFIRPDMTDEVRSAASMSRVPEFREMLAPLYLRRLREQVLQELPPIEPQYEWCAMTVQDVAAYIECLEARDVHGMRRVSFQHDDMKNSAKAVRLAELAEEIALENRKGVVYSFYRDTVSKAAALLGPKCAGVITGSTPVEERQAIIDDFTNGPDGRVLVCQIQAGGTGLNIQTASVVIFCEPQIKPSLEHQALSRVYRMGQIRNVLVFHLVCPETIDEAILDVLAEKQAEFDNYAEDSTMAEATETIVDRDWINAYIDNELARYLAASPSDGQ